MKLFVALVVLVQVVFAAKLPGQLKFLQCKRDTPDLGKCILDSLEKGRPLLIQGIKELGIPPIDPFVLPYMSVNRTISELVSINSVLRNVKTLGLGNFIIDSLIVNPEKLSAEVRYTLPWAYLEMEYDVGGQLLRIPLKSNGFFKGNFTDTQMAVKMTMKTYEKDGDTYLRVDKMTVKGQVGDGWVKMTAKNPELQFGADLISNFFNENPRVVFDAVNPIFVEFSADLFKAVGNQILAKLPAKEIFID
ncbi:hypothetical protein WA026_000744 [Henosepilachna vigintioctopunctata]|uniref:Uncharacterized protein n=1 Tax=Henosepilachna vigintioctopunctata TaxID=420089 RepID=A0AAW1V539_9CUCU